MLVSSILDVLASNEARLGKTQAVCSRFPTVMVVDVARAGGVYMFARTLG